jgi:hypothetical protein
MEVEPMEEGGINDGAGEEVVMEDNALRKVKD